MNNITFTAPQFIKLDVDSILAWLASHEFIEGVDWDFTVDYKYSTESNQYFIFSFTKIEDAVLFKIKFGV